MTLSLFIYISDTNTHTHTRTLEQWVFTRLSGSPAWVQGIFITWQASLWGNWVGNPAILIGIPNTSQVISLSCSVSLDEHPLNSYLKSWSPALAALELCYEIVQEGRTCSLWSLVPLALLYLSSLGCISLSPEQLWVTLAGNCASSIQHGWKTVRDDVM